MAAQLTSEQMRYLASCPGFAKVALKLGDDVFPKMEAIFRACDEVMRPGEPATRKISVVTCNGAGKTTRIMPAVAFWFMATFRNATVVYTTADGKQLSNQFWPNVEKYAYHFVKWEARRSEKTLKAPNGSRLIGFTTDDAGRAEGWHGCNDMQRVLDGVDGPLLILIDEAKTVPDFIFDAFERCTYALQLSASSPGPAEGRFYEYHSKLRQYVQCFRINGDPDNSDAPHLDHAKNRQMIEMYGRESPLVQSKVFAQFMENNSDAIISLKNLNRNYDQPPQYRDNRDRIGFCDFAAGGDENVFAIRVGNLVQIRDCWREIDTNAVIGRFLKNFVDVQRKYGFQAVNIGGDADGLGKPIIDSLHNAGWAIRRLHNGGKAQNEHYFNRSSETWGQGAQLIEDCKYILPDDDILHDQLVCRKWIFDRSGRLRCEPKDVMKRRGLSSPDRAEAVLECLRPARNATLETIAFGKGYDIEPGVYTDRHVDDSVLAAIGAEGDI